MSERGAALIEALLATLIAGVIGAAAMRVIADLPARAAQWEDASAVRQRLRTFEARLARLMARASPIEIDVSGAGVRIPSIWPRRLGFWSPGAPADVSSAEVTVLSRPDSHRALALASALGAAGGEVFVAARPGCGSDPVCAVRPGDFLLAVAADGACGLFRVLTAGSRWELFPLMQSGAPVFAPGSALVPVAIDVISFVAAERAVRRYDGYRSESVMIDGLSDVMFTLAADSGVVLGDGPFAGSGALAYDVDQLRVRGVTARVTMEQANASPLVLVDVLEWTFPRWP